MSAARSWRRSARCPPATERRSTVGLAALLAAGALVLFIICTNLAGMMLARGAAGQRDLAVRAAMGASRGRLVRRVLVEAATLAVGGGVLGGLAAWWATRLAASSALLGLPDVDLTPDARVLAFSCLLVLATSLAIGLLPALRLTRAGAIGSLRDEMGAGGRRAGRFHRVAVSAQVGVAVLFVAMSGVFVRSLSQLDRRDLGFDPQRLLVVSLDLSAQGYEDPARGLDFADRVRASVAALPGVRAVAIADGLPVDLVGNFTSASRADSRDAEAEGVQTEFTRVGPGFFQAVGTRVLRGRGIEARRHDVRSAGRRDHQAARRTPLAGRRCPGATGSAAARQGRRGRAAHRRRGRARRRLEPADGGLAAGVRGPRAALRSPAGPPARQVAGGCRVADAAGAVGDPIGGSPLRDLVGGDRERHCSRAAWSPSASRR